MWLINTRTHTHTEHAYYGDNIKILQGIDSGPWNFKVSFDSTYTMVVPKVDNIALDIHDKHTHMPASSAKAITISILLHPFFTSPIHNGP